MPEVLPAEHSADHSAEWHAFRRSGIGSSEIYTIAAGSHYSTTSVDVWRRKVYDLPPDRPSLAMRHGALCEPVVATLWEEQYPPDNPDYAHLRLSDTGSWRHPDIPHHIANPDRLIGDHAGLEIKTTNPDRGYEQWSRKMNLAAVWQSQWCMHVTGRDTWYIAVWAWDKPLLTYRITRDTDLIEWLCERADEFWEQVQNRVPPPESMPEDVYPAATAKPAQVVADDRTLGLWQELSKVREKLADTSYSADHLQRRKNDLTVELQGILGEATELVDANGDVLATWKPTTRTGWDSAALRALALEHPQIMQAEKSTQTRQFRIKGK